MNLDLINLKLSAQRALLGNVFPNLRAVCINFSENLIYFYFYIDQEISEDYRESCQSAIDDVIADFCNVIHNGKEIEFETSIMRLDFPQKPPLNGCWVYYRSE